MKGKNIYFSVGLSCLISLFFVLGVYYCHEFPRTGNATRADWGTFGDYFGGILNPILSIINILLLAYFSVKVANLEDSRFEESIKIQKEVALYELKQSALLGATKILNKIYDDVAEISQDTTVMLTNHRNQLNSFLTVHTHLIPHFKDVKEPFKSIIQKLINRSINYWEAKKIGSPNLSEQEEGLGKELDEFLTMIDDLVSNAQQNF